MNILKSKHRSLFIFLTYLLAAIAIFGLGLFLGISGHSDSNQYIKVNYILTLMAMFGFFVIVVIEFIAPYINKNARRDTFFAALGIFLCIMFSYDALEYFVYLDLKIDLGKINLLLVFKNLYFAAFIMTQLFFHKFFARTYKLHSDKMEYYITVFLMAIIHIMYIVLSFFDYGYIAFIFLFILSFYWIIKFNIMVIKENRADYIFYASNLILIVSSFAGLTCTISEMPNSHISGRGILPIATIICFFLFLSIYLYFTISTERRANEKEEYERKLNELQSTALKNQINPHFVFNALSVVRSLYHEDVEKGDYAVDLLSKHLRAYVDAGDTFLVPLERELKIVDGYLELENLKVSRPFNIIYDIDVYDFLVPSFSIQTLIENAVRYSRINEKEDGHISISTYEEDKYIILTISDNGFGFDVNSITSKSTGIRNTRDRFKITLDATLEISSIINEGTSIKIKIPKEKAEIK